MRLRIDGNMNTGFYPASGSLDGGRTLCHALVYIDDGVPSIELIYPEIICCGLNPTGMMSNVIILYRLARPRLI